MLRKLTDALGQRLVKNALALYGVTIANSILPLVTVPYLARILRPEAWGMVLFSQTIASWLVLLVEYGFVYSATREIAQHAQQPEKLREIVSQVMLSKLILSLLAVAVGAGLWGSVPTLQHHTAFLVGAIWIAIAQGLSPLWYFQGIERMLAAASLEVGCRCLFTIAVFLYIKTPEDAVKVVLYQAASFTLSLAICLYLMYRPLGFAKGSWRRSADVLREGRHFFIFVAVVNLYAKANSFLLGILASPGAVSFFGGPERLLRGFLSFTGPINQVLYPRLAYLVKHDLPAAWIVVRRGAVLVGLMALLMGLTLSLGAHWFVHLLFGPGYERAEPVLRVLGMVCPFSALNSLLGIRWMFPLGLERTYNRIVLGGAVLDLLLVATLATRYREQGVAWALLAAESFITVLVFIVLWRQRLNPFQACGSSNPTAGTPRGEVH